MSMVAKIEAQGWRQGSLISIGRLGESVLLAFPQTLDPSGYFLVLTQDCDLVHDSLPNEPLVEFLICTETKIADNGKLFGKDPRRIQFYSKINGVEKRLEAFPHGRAFLDRSALCKSAPDLNTNIDRKTLFTITQWLSKRYSRPALPDEFNKRFAAAGKALETILKADGALFPKIYFQLDPFDRELMPNESYKLSIRAVVTAETAKDRTKNDAAQLAVLRISKAISEISTIILVSCDVWSEEDFTLDDLHYFREFPRYDYLSNRQQS